MAIKPEWGNYSDLQRSRMFLEEINRLKKFRSEKREQESTDIGILTPFIKQYDPYLTLPTVTTTTATEMKQESRALAEALKTISELQSTLQNIQQEPLVLRVVHRISKCKKFAFVKKGDVEIRINSTKGLERGDEVLVHPKTQQIVERIGKSESQASLFQPESIPDVQWDDIGGLDEAKATMIEAIELPHKNKDLMSFYGKKQIKGLLLCGPPGCGKTMLGKAAATSLATIYGDKKAKTGFLYVKGPEILNCYVGETEKTIRNIFMDARRHKEQHGYPAIVFLDEADAILAARGTRSVGIGNTIVPAFLTEMDGLEESSAIVIIATNRPDVLDPAIVRDGRIDRRLTVTRPRLEEGTKIILMNLKRVPLVKGIKIDSLAEEMGVSFYHHDRFVRQGVRLSDMVNGAMLANCVEIASSFAMRRDMENGKRSGVTIEDGINAVNYVQRQNAMIRHDLEIQV